MTLHIVPATVRGEPAWLVVVMSGDGFKVHPMAMRDPAGALALLRVLERGVTAPSPAEFAGQLASECPEEGGCRGHAEPIDLTGSELAETERELDHQLAVRRQRLN
jgi:hypothetical protein